jgi:site-specific DNA recombinase
MGKIRENMEQSKGKPMGKPSKQSLVLGYIRVSHVKQVKSGESLEAQKLRIRQYCEFQGLGKPKIIEDAGISGGTIAGRDGMKEILALVRAGRVSDLIVLKLDRLARNTREALETSDLLQKKGTTLHSVNEKIDTSTASGKLFFTLLNTLAEWEKNTVSERVKAVFEVKRAKNERISRLPNYGYRFVEGKLSKNPKEQKIIAEMLRLKATGLSLDKIGEALFKTGITNRNGKRFSPSSVFKILKNDEERQG